jgi:hypothetical protein
VKANHEENVIIDEEAIKWWGRVEERLRCAFQ